MGSVFLTGFMATGKSAVGRELARRLGIRYFDTDAEIERSTSRTIAQLFEERGEPAFRELERAMIETACRLPEAVVATGGGAILDPSNRSRMQAVGKIVCLEASPEVILERSGDFRSRPLLAGAKDPLQRIRELLEQREAVYRSADLRVDTGRRSLAEIAQQIVDWLRQ